MRVRTVVAFVLLLLPAGVSAQRIPRIGARGPATPTDLPPVPAPVAKALAYKRLRVAFESYPLVSHFSSPGFLSEGVSQRWTSFGMGTRADYRIAPLTSATLDMTSTMLGGPARTSTVELGLRFRPDITTGKVYPFIDVRGGYLFAYDSYFGTVSDPYGMPTPGFGPGSRYSRGPGALVGTGVEYAVTNSMSVILSGAVMQTDMSTRSFRGPAPGTYSYKMRQYRTTLGLRFNPVAILHPPGTELP